MTIDTTEPEFCNYDISSVVALCDLPRCSTFKVKIGSITYKSIQILSTETIKQHNTCYIILHNILMSFELSVNFLNWL